MSLEIPFIGMMVLTMIVWFYMYYRRLSYMYKMRVDPQDFATRQGAQNLPEAVRRPAENLQNLFELPVLFYVLVFYLVWENQAGVMDIYLGYVFFLGRIAHSFIHCGYNKVTHRFSAYVISSLALWVMVLRVLWGWVGF